MKNRIDQKFNKLRQDKRTGFIAYITGGDPDFDTTIRLVLELEKVGVDIIELGVPFSDPMADGLTNQKAAERALKNNTSLRDILIAVEEIRNFSEIPIVLFTYLNPVYRYGWDKFAKDAGKAGVDGVLFLDLLPENKDLKDEALRKHGITRIFLIAPTTPVHRIKMICREAQNGFLYYISRTGVTGACEQLEKGIRTQILRIRKYTDLPIAVGFGISKPAHVKRLKGIVDAVVVGSAIVKKIEENLGGKELVSKVTTFVRELVSPL